MQFVYHKNSGDDYIKINKETFRHIFFSRREKKKSFLYFRNLKEDNLYRYQIEDINRKNATVKLVSSETKIVRPMKFLHIIWCIIEPRSIEKTLPMLNEIGVSKITFVYCKNSQHNYKLNIDKITNILIKSSQQCGRSNIIEFCIENSLNKFKSKDIYILDFNGQESYTNNIQTVIIGSEGGFSRCEKDILNINPKIGFTTKAILKSQTAIISVASKILL